MGHGESPHLRSHPAPADAHEWAEVGGPPRPPRSAPSPSDGRFGVPKPILRDLSNPQPHEGPRVKAPAPGSTRRAGQPLSLKKGRCRALRLAWPMRSAPGPGHTRGRLAKPPRGHRLTLEGPAPGLNAQPERATPLLLGAHGRKLSRGPATHRDPGSANRGARGVGTWGAAVMTPRRPAGTSPRPPLPPRPAAPELGPRGQRPLPCEHQAGGSAFAHLANPSARGCWRVQPQGSATVGGMSGDPRLNPSPSPTSWRQAGPPAARASSQPLTAGQQGPASRRC